MTSLRGNAVALNSDAINMQDDIDNVINLEFGYMGDFDTAESNKNHEQTHSVAYEDLEFTAAKSGALQADVSNNRAKDMPESPYIAHDSRLIAASEKYEKRYAYRFVKRLFDMFASAVALVLLSPIFLLTAILIKHEDGGPVFYSQIRVTYKNTRFKILKFRSMRIDAEKKLNDLMTANEAGGPQFKIKDDPRCTKIGRLIRKLSIDEFPQLWNVLKGDISLVGPRPNQIHVVDKYTDFEKQRFLVRGGLASYRECNGRSNLSFEEWIQYDLMYVDSCSIFVDLSIMIKTVIAVIKREGAE